MTFDEQIDSYSLQMARAIEEKVCLLAADISSLQLEQQLRRAKRINELVRRQYELMILALTPPEFTVNPDGLRALQSSCLHRNTYKVRVVGRLNPVGEYCEDCGVGLNRDYEATFDV